MTLIWPSMAFWLSALRRARRRICLGILCEKSRGRGPKTLPPPFMHRSLVEPSRARPEPFQLKGLLPHLGRVALALVTVGTFGALAARPRGAFGHVGNVR